MRERLEDGKHVVPQVALVRESGIPRQVVTFRLCETVVTRDAQLAQRRKDWGHQ
jgi:hypothetical protein